MIGSNPLLAPILAASMTNNPGTLGTPNTPSGPTGLPGLLSNLPGMANPSGNDMGQQTQMLQAMSQLLMLNNPGSAPNPNIQSAALLQSQVRYFITFWLQHFHLIISTFHLNDFCIST